MLVPREKPHLTGLNSYYLQIDRFVEHLQGEIGSGCIYCQAVDQELLVYFDEHEILRGVVQDDGQKSHISPSLGPVLQALQSKNFKVSVYYLEPGAIFFWSQMAPFKRAKNQLTSQDIGLPELMYRLEQKKFSGFVDVELQDGESGLLFLHQGKRIGGSYSWGRGGLNPREEPYKELVERLTGSGATYRVGHFQKDPAEKKVPSGDGIATADVVGSPSFADLATALEEFLEIFCRSMKRRSRQDPVLLLKQCFLDHLDQYPFLDPFSSSFQYENEQVILADEAEGEEIARAVVGLAWEVAISHRAEKKFRAELGKWAYRSALEDRGIAVER
ncbi:hypothetical protein [Desulfolithobacter sp.]